MPTAPRTRVATLTPPSCCARGVLQGAPGARWVARGAGGVPEPALPAQVSLFSDPPQPSRSLAVGTVATGCPVMTLSIPQARTAALGMATAPATAPAPPGAGVLIRVPCPSPRPPAPVLGGRMLPHSPFPTLPSPVPRGHFVLVFSRSCSPGTVRAGGFTPTSVPSSARGGLPHLPRAVLLPRPPAHPGAGGAEPQAAGTGKGWEGGLWEGGL